ncbi:3653_t:CDS:2, partial [Dentiscutata erythropus]
LTSGVGIYYYFTYHDPKTLSSPEVLNDVSVRRDNSKVRFPIMKSGLALEKNAEKPIRMRDKMEKYIISLQERIVKEIESIDGKKFYIDRWERAQGGYGISCILQSGNVFEKAGVNISVVSGDLPVPAVQQMKSRHKELDPEK